MMKPNKKAKWIVGITGTTLSAFILSQLDTSAAANNSKNQPVAYQTEAATNNTNAVSTKENKDWNNFTVDSNTEKKSKAVASTQSTGQSTNQSTETVKQSITKQPSSKSTSKSASQPSSQSTSKPISQPSSKSISQPKSQPAKQPSQPKSQPVKQPSQPATNTTVSQPVVQQQPVAPPTDRNTSRS